MELILIAAGSLASEASVAVDELRTRGIKAGVVGIRVYRPFPVKEIVEALKGVDMALVLDKSLSYGNGGPIGVDVKSALYGVEYAPAVRGLVAGLGGRDVKASELVQVAEENLAALKKGDPDLTNGWINCCATDNS